MDNNLTFDEVEKDRIASATDLELLQKISDSIGRFISNGYTCGENRSFLRADLVKWEGMFKHASGLHELILKKHAQLKQLS